MTLEQLRIFLAVAERGHLTQAADALALTPSAVSAALRTLEHRYDVRLFDRIGRGIALTDAGRIFVDQARGVLLQAASAERLLTDLAGSARGRIRIQASQTIASYWLPRPLLRFKQRFPGIDIELANGNTQTVAQAVVDGRADIGLVEGDTAEPGLVRDEVGIDRLVVVVAPDHPWARAKKLTVADLPRGKWIGREAGSGTRDVFERFLKANGVVLEDLETVMTFPSNEAVLNAVEESEFAAAVSALAAGSALAAKRLVRVGVDTPARAFSVLTHRERFRTRALEAFVRELTGKAI